MYHQHTVTRKERPYRESSAHNATKESWDDPLLYEAWAGPLLGRTVL